MLETVPEASGVPVPVASTARQVRRIQASRGFIPIDFGEIWRYRQLLWYFIARDIKSRYKQTFVGPLWALLRPFMSMVLFSAIFGGLAGIESGSGIPYPLFVYPGVLVFTYFSSVLTGTAASLVGSGNLITKVYFPRVFAPLSAATAPLVDFLIALTIVFGLFAYYQRLPSWHIVFLPCFLVLAILSGLGIGIWLAGASVRYRDVPFMLPYVIQMWLYATPIIYPVSLVPEHYRWLLALNPMTAVVDGFRWSILGTTPPSLGVLLGSAGFESCSRPPDCSSFDGLSERSWT